MDNKALEENAIKNIDETHKQQKLPKIAVPRTRINVDTIKKNVSMPASPRLTTPFSARGSCLCSPTTHVGSFRCRFHRSNSGLIRGASFGSNLSELAAKSGYNCD